MSSYTLEATAKMRHGYGFFVAPNGTAGLRAPMFDEVGGVKHAFSTRLGGVSSAPYDSLNLSWSRAESYETAEENFKLFCEGFGFSYPSLAIINYEHGTTVLPLTEKDCGRGFAREALPFCDGLVTNDPNVTLVTSHADCGVLFFYDPKKRAVGIAHAGWKGTRGRIGARVVERMRECYGCVPKDILSAIGPCICRACFEVDIGLAEDFAREFDDEAIYSPGKPGKGQLDLERAAAIQLLDAGVLPEHITLMHSCTYHNPELYFSYRRDHGETGSMSGFIALK